MGVDTKGVRFYRYTCILVVVTCHGTSGTLFTVRSTSGLSVIVNLTKSYSCPTYNTNVVGKIFSKSNSLGLKFT